MQTDIQYGASSLSEIREVKAKYIDKTEQIYKLITGKNRRFFLSRPRRFGKTLLVDTLSEIFKGNKKLFKGLSIYKKDYDWKSYPVIRLDMSSVNKSTPELVERALTEKVKEIALSFNVNVASFTSIKDSNSYLSVLINELKKRSKKVVVLIDEYDYPVINHLHEGEKIASSFLNVLQNFYLSLKVNSNSIHFLFLTGVTQLAHTTIFSGLNNLKDISYLPQYIDLLGYTQKELESNFKKEITKGAKTHSLSERAFLNKVKEWYDGFRFSTKKTTVYNPSDINLFFQDKATFNTYWISTGTPSFILKLLSKYPKFDLQKELQNPKSRFLNNNIINLDTKITSRTLIFLLYQTGYISITDIDKDGYYILGFPNKEVSISFTNYLTSVLFKEDLSFFDDFTYITKPLTEGHPSKFVENLDTLFKSLSHPTQKYQENSIGLAILTILSLSPNIDVESQIHSGKGVTDIVALTKDTIYIVELKIGSKSSSKKALSQIKEKNYSNLYKSKAKYRGKKIVLMGISFNSKDATVTGLAMDPDIN